MSQLIDINTAIIAGRLTHDVVLSHDRHGDPWSTFQIAAHCKTTDRKTKRRDHTRVDFVQCAASCTIAEIAAQLRTGQQVLIQGKLRDIVYRGQHRLKVLADRIWVLDESQ